MQDRRAFLKSLGLGGVGVASVALLPSLPSLPSAAEDVLPVKDSSQGIVIARALPNAAAYSGKAMVTNVDVTTRDELGLWSWDVMIQLVGVGALTCTRDNAPGAHGICVTLPDGQCWGVGDVGLASG